MLPVRLHLCSDLPCTTGFPAMLLIKKQPNFTCPTWISQQGQYVIPGFLLPHLKPTLGVWKQDHAGTSAFAFYVVYHPKNSASLWTRHRRQWTEQVTLHIQEGPVLAIGQASWYFYIFTFFYLQIKLSDAN